MKDLNGNNVKEGDVLIQHCGFSKNENGAFEVFRIFEYVDEPDTVGIMYDIDGNKIKYWHCNARKSVVINKTHPHLVEMFKNGEHEIGFKIEDIDFRYVEF